MMKATVIIPTLNRSASLHKTIASIILQTVSSDCYEVIVVDAGSTDDTLKTVERAIESNPHHHIRYIHEAEPGTLAARHRGADEAFGHILVFIHDDIEAAPGWLGAIIARFDDPLVQIVGGRNLPKYETDPPAWIDSFWEHVADGGRLCRSLNLLDLGAEVRKMHPNIIRTLNFAIRRYALIEVGGFHPDKFPGGLQQFVGDGDAGLKVVAKIRNYLTIYEPEATIYHLVPSSRMTPEYFEQRSYIRGIRASYTELRLGRTANNSPWSITQRLSSRIIEPAMHWRRSLITQASDQRAMMAKRVINAREAGYTFHQRAVRDDPSLLNWVKRPDYWNYRLPAIIDRAGIGAIPTVAAR